MLYKKVIQLKPAFLEMKKDFEIFRQIILSFQFRKTLISSTDIRHKFL